MILSAMLYSGKAASFGTDVVVVDDVVVVGDVVVVVVVVETVVDVVEVGSFDDVHETTTNAIAAIR
jgi:hypothetical protein